MQQIDLDLDKENELVFRLSIEGTKPASTKTRFLLESSEYSLVFPASNSEGGEVSIVIPPLENVLREGNHVGTLEVIIDDRVFTPIKIDTNFEKSVSVVAEAVVSRRKETKVTASHPVVVNKKRERQPERKRPAQRNRERPVQSLLNETRSVSSGKTLEHYIKRIASDKNINLTAKQINEITKRYNLLKGGDKK
jgi:hypothetical protein